MLPRRGPIHPWLRVVCGALALVLIAAALIVGLQGGRELVRALPALVIGLLFLIPAARAGAPKPGTGLDEIAARFYDARFVARWGLGSGFLGLLGIKLLDRSLGPIPVSGTASGRILQLMFAALFVVGFVAAFFTVYYGDLGKKMADEEERDVEDA